MPNTKTFYQAFVSSQSRPSLLAWAVVAPGGDGVPWSAARDSRRAAPKACFPHHILLPLHSHGPGWAHWEMRGWPLVQVARVSRRQQQSSQLSSGLTGRPGHEAPSQDSAQGSLRPLHCEPQGRWGSLPCAVRWPGILSLLSSPPLLWCLSQEAPTPGESYPWSRPTCWSYVLGPATEARAVTDQPLRWPGLLPGRTLSAPCPRHHPAPHLGSQACLNSPILPAAAASLAPRPRQWLWPTHLALGKLNLTQPSCLSSCSCMHQRSPAHGCVYTPFLPHVGPRRVQRGAGMAAVPGGPCSAEGGPRAPQGQRGAGAQ